MKKEKKRIPLITRWERWIMTPETDIFASSSSSAKTVKATIDWYNNVKKAVE